MKALSQNLSKTNPSATLKIGSLLKEFSTKGFDTVDFGVGEPNFDLFNSVKQAGVEAINKNKNKYTPVSGTLELKEAIKHKLKRDNHLDYDVSQIIVSNGAKHSLFNLFMAICNPDDEIIIPVPYWVSYADQVVLAGAKPIFVKTDENFILTADELKKAITKHTKAVIINSPSNPTGAVIPKDELEKIAKVAIEHDIYIISDEVYEYFTFDNHQHISIASLSKEAFEHTITINACSKSHSMTGLRVGYAAGPKNIIKLMDTFQGQTTSGASSVSQSMATAALKITKSEMNETIAGFKRKRDLAVSLLESEGFSVKTPMGAFYIFLDVSKFNKSSEDFSQKLLEQEYVAVVPGCAFGFEGFVRLSYAISEDKIKEGIKRIGKFIRSN